MVSEETIAAHVVHWLTSEGGWEVYQEVSAGARADIVATRGLAMHVIEVKTSLSMALLEQAVAWRHHAHMTSVAIPERKRGSRDGFAVAALFGLGILEVGPLGRVREIRRADFSRPKEPEFLRRRLNEAQKTYAPAGNARGRFWSPFQQTCEDLRRFVEKNPGVPLKAAIEGISHHYRTEASARSALAKWIEAGSVPGVVIAKDERGKTVLRPALDGAA